MFAQHLLLSIVTCVAAEMSLHLHSSMHLLKADQMAVWFVAALAPIIEQHGVPDRLLAKGFTNMFNSLACSILSQQLAVKAASVIQGRFMALCQVRPAVFALWMMSCNCLAVGCHQEQSGVLIQCEEFATPEAVLALDKEQLRGVGLSYAKVCAKEELLDHARAQSEKHSAQSAVLASMW